MLTQLDDVRSDFSEEEQALFAALMREGLKAKLPEDVTRQAEAEVEAEAGATQNGNGQSGQISEEAVRKVADSIMAFRDGLDNDEDKRLVDSIIVDAAAPEGDDDVQGHYWVFKWDIGAPTSGSVYTFYRNYCNTTGGGRSTYLVANFGTFWTHYRCYVWY